MEAGGIAVRGGGGREYESAHLRLLNVATQAGLHHQPAISSSKNTRVRFQDLVKSDGSLSQCDRDASQNAEKGDGQNAEG